MTDASQFILEIPPDDEPAPDQIPHDQARFRNHPFRCVYCGSEHHGTDGCSANDEGLND